MLSMDGMAVPLWALSGGRDPERETRGYEKRSRERRRRDEVLKRRRCCEGRGRKGKVCEVMQLAAAVCGGQLLYGPCCIVPPFCLADPLFDLPIL